MITVITEECNEISQDFYDAAMVSFQFGQLQCSCGCSGCLVGHGCYIRSVKTPLGKVSLMIRRVQCTLCNTTHALLPSTIVPYSQVPFTEQASIASSYENGGSGMEAMEDNPELSPNQVWYIRPSTSASGVNISQVSASCFPLPISLPYPVCAASDVSSCR